LNLPAPPRRHNPSRPASKAPRKRKPDNPEQFERFVEAARKADVDETGEEFERAFGKIIRRRPDTTKSRS
jgi:hypothetical protein